MKNCKENELIYFKTINSNYKVPMLKKMLNNMEKCGRINKEYKITVVNRRSYIKCAIRAQIDRCWINRNNKINITNIKPTYNIKNLLQIKKF